MDIQNLFKDQIGERSYHKQRVTFIVHHEKEPDEVVSWSAKKLEEILESFIFVGVEKNRLPRFKRIK